MYDEGIGPNHDGIKANDLEEVLDLDLEYTARTSLRHLMDVGMIEEFAPPGPSILVIAEWKGTDGKIVNGEVGNAIDEGIAALITHIQKEDSSPSSRDDSIIADGGPTTPRIVVADRFDVMPDKIETFLRTTDERVDTLNAAVEAIEESDEVTVGNEYGKISFIHTAYRYRLTEKSIRLHER